MGFINALGEELVSMGVVVSEAGFSCGDHVSVHSVAGWWYRNSISSLQTGYPIKVSYIGLLYAYPHSQ